MQIEDAKQLWILKARSSMSIPYVDLVESYRPSAEASSERKIIIVRQIGEKRPSAFSPLAPFLGKNAEENEEAARSTST